jgi:hypothetical protein
MITACFCRVVALADEPNVLVHLVLVTIHNHPAGGLSDIRDGIR